VQRKKIVLIGAGSVVFTQVLVADFMASCPEDGLLLGLVDTNPEALEVVDQLVRRMVAARAADVEVQASTERRDVLPGADVVVTTIAVGGRRAWEADVLIPRRYGVFQPVGDTAMPGGISRAMRMIPAMVAIARDVQALCPDAAFFNYANPMTANCLAIRRATGAAVVGLCHGTFGTERYLARFADVPAERVTTLGVGLNHFTFLSDLRCDGEDLWPRVRGVLAQTGAAGTEHPFSWSLLDRFSAFPAPGDRHVVEFLPEEFPGGRYFGKTLGVDAFSFERTIESGDRRHEEAIELAAGRLPLPERVFTSRGAESEQLVAMVRAINGDTRRCFYVNAPNQGACPQLPADAILELPAVATATGFRTMQVAPISAPLRAVLSRRLAVVDVAVEAALRGDRNLFVEAVLADGAVSDPVVAGKLVDDLLAAHRAHLPQF
jgi:alpha-galactosidase